MSLETIFKLSVVLKMVDQLSTPSRHAGNQITQLEQRVESLSSKSKNMIQTSAGMAAAAVGISQAILQPVQATYDTGRALGELSSLGVKDLEAVEDAAKSFSNQWSGTTAAEFIGASYDIKSGISSLSDTGVAEYTRLSGLTAKATKSSVADMTSLFATGYGIYKDYYKSMSDESFGRMFSGGISSAVQMFKTTGPEMSEAISNLGAAATSAGRPLEEQLAVLGMLQATMPGSEAGTQYKAFIQSAAGAGTDLGLKFTDANNQLLSMGDILGKLRGKYGETLDALEKQELTKAFGTDEAVALIDLLYPKVDSLNQNVVTLQGNMAGGTAITEQMAAAMNADPGAKWTLMTQRLQNLKESVGNALNPVLTPKINSLSDMLLKLSQWVDMNKDLAGSLGVAALGIASIIAVAALLGATIGGLGWAMGRFFGGLITVWKGLKWLGNGFTTLRIAGMYGLDALRIGAGKLAQGAGIARTGAVKLGTSIATYGRQAAIAAAGGLKSITMGVIRFGVQATKTAIGALPKLTAATWRFTVALLANPITWIILAIIALVVAIILLYKNWDKVTAFLSQSWQTIKNGFTAGKDWLVGGIQNILGIFTEKMAAFKQSGAALIQAFVDGIKSVIMKPYDVVKDGLAKVRQLLPFSDAKEGPLSSLTRSGRAMVETFAYGITDKSALLYQVTSGVLGGAMAGLQAGSFGLAGAGAPSVGFSARESVSLREIFRDSQTTRERETVHSSSTGPLVQLNYRSGSRRDADNLTRSLRRWLDSHRE